MATFTESEQNTIKMALGYGSVANVITDELRTDRAPELIAQALAVLAVLAAIDQQLIDARQDSMAQAVGQLRLSYSQHVAHLKSEGTRSLKELSNLLGLRVLYNKYGRSGSTAVVSYW